MEDFKSNTKMQCFKEGGSVKYESRKEHKEEMKSDMAQDKAIVKKGVRQHESNLHKGEPKTELKLKAGGRAKKSAGTVKKFDKASGEYGAKKTTSDKKNIKEAKQFKPVKLCGGKSVNKYEEGGSVFDDLKSGAVKLKNNILGTPEQNRIAQEQMDNQAAQGSKLAKFFGGKSPMGKVKNREVEPTETDSIPFNKKRGGKAC